MTTTNNAIAKCRCGTVTTVRDIYNSWRTDEDTYRTFARYARLSCRSCGRLAVAKAVIGKHNPAKECSARCTGATGPACECECGGENHGGRFAA